MPTPKPTDPDLHFSMPIHRQISIRIDTLATVTVEGFWGDFALVMGALLILFSLMETGVTEAWTKWMTVIGASLLATGTILTVGSDLNAYAEKHIAQGALASVPFIVVGVLVPRRFFRAVRAKRSSHSENAPRDFGKE
jgi:hypothetical protein